MSSTTPPIHLVIMQPAGYIHSLGLLDPARYLRYQLRRLGAVVTLAKNRLREDAINIVFGAHLGFPAGLKQRHTCVFVNLEQLGSGGAGVSTEYIELLQNSAVIDYDADNVSSYSADLNSVPLLPMGHAPYLDQPGFDDLEGRPIDLLFFGSMNARRQALIDRIESCGVLVSVFDKPVYGPERDDFIRQAKAVLNCHFYESSRFEQVRAAHCLSLGTPIVSERGPQTRPMTAFQESVSWFDDANVENFFNGHFLTPAYFEAARNQLSHFRSHDPRDAIEQLLKFAIEVHEISTPKRDSSPLRPSLLNLGSGKDYRPGWFNVDILDSAQPDLVLDLGKPIELPVRASTRFGAEVMLEAGQLTKIFANNVLEHVPDLPMLMGNALKLLQPGGEIDIEVPYEKSLTAWQDPTHLRAMNENSWIYYIEWFWYLGWFEHRFEMVESSWLDGNLGPCDKEQASFMRVSLRKTETSPAERTVARAMQADFGGIDDEFSQQQDFSLGQTLNKSSDVAAIPAVSVQPARDRVMGFTHSNSSVNSSPPSPSDPSDFEIGALVKNGDAANATRLIVTTVDSSLTAPIAQRRRLYPKMDRYVEKLARALADGCDESALHQRDGGTLLIASEATNLGEHDQAMLQISQDADRPLLLLTDLFNTYANQPDELQAVKRRFSHADVVLLPRGSHWEKSCMIFRATAAIRPAAIYYFGHHQDAMQFIGTAGLPGSDKYFVHFGTRDPRLGDTLPGLRRIDWAECVSAARAGETGYRRNPQIRRDMARA